MLKQSQFILAILAALSGALFWFLAAPAFDDTGGFFVIYVVADFIIYVSLVGLCFLLLPPKFISLAIFLGSLPLFLFIKDTLTASLLILAFSASVFIPSLRIKRESESRLYFSAPRILRKGVPFFLTLFALVLAIFSYNPKSSLGFEDIFPRTIFDSAFNLLSRNGVGFVKLPFSVPDPEKKVDEVILENVSLEAGITADEIPSSERERVLSEGRKELSNALGIRINPSDKIGDVLYFYLISLLEKAFVSAEPYLPEIFSLGVFVSARALFVIVGWVSVFLSWVILKFMLLSGFAVLETRSSSQQFLRAG